MKKHVLALGSILSATFAGFVATPLTGSAQTPGGTGSNAGPPVVTITAAVPWAFEGTTNAGAFEFRRSGGSDDLTVFYQVSGSASNGVDYELLPGTIIIPAKAPSVRLLVQAINDDLIEGAETVVVQVVPSPAMGPIEPYRVGFPSNATVVIRDDEVLPQAVVTIVATDPVAQEIPPVPPGMGMPQRFDPAVFTVYRTGGDTNLAMDVYYHVGGTASNGVDYELISNSVTIPAKALSATIQIAPIDDNLAEGDETVVLTLEPVACPAIYPPPPNCYRIGRPDSAVAIIQDNDSAPRVQMVMPGNGQVFTAPADLPIKVTAVDPDGYVDRMEIFAGTNRILQETRLFLVPPPPGQTSVWEFVWSNVPPGRHLVTAKGTDNQVNPGWSGPVTVSVVQTNPPASKAVPFVSIVATDPLAYEGVVVWCSNAIVGASVVGPNYVWVTNSGGTNLCWGPNPWITNFWGPKTAVFTVRRSGQPEGELTVYYAISGTASNGADYQTLPGVLTVPAGQRTAAITVVPIDDDLVEGIETVVLALTLPPDLGSNPPPYAVGWPARAAALIVDNDRPRPPTVVLPDRRFHFCEPATNGFWHRIEASTDLLQWTTVCTNVVTDGALHFVDPDPASLPARFYRAVPTPAPGD